MTPSVGTCRNCWVVAVCWETPLGPMCVGCRPRGATRARFVCHRGHPLLVYRRRTPGGHTYCSACLAERPIRRRSGARS